jgi:vancomycin resistance protein YoaR
MSDTIDGEVVAPGESFSINATVGERTSGKGYVPAPAIIGGEVYCCDHPANIGGGVSQVATTLYNAVFFAGLEDVFHQPHSLYISRYPMGREATLGWTAPDLVFSNDTSTPVTIDMSYSDTSLTATLYGDNEGREVEAGITGTATPEGGGTVTVYRYITYLNGEITESWTWTYQAPANGIVLPF